MPITNTFGCTDGSNDRRSNSSEVRIFLLKNNAKIARGMLFFNFLREIHCYAYKAASAEMFCE